MSTPLPVSSKVAVTAIRGLIVGTTCSLAIITEDRRRRIKSAHSAIRNGERIRSARNYHAGGAALALAIEEDALLFEPAPRPRSSSLDRLERLSARFGQAERESLPASEPTATERRADAPESVEEKLSSSVTRHLEDGSLNKTLDTQTPARAKLKVPTLEHPTSIPIRRTTASVVGAAQEKLNSIAAPGQSPFAFPTKDEIYTMIHDAAENKDRQLLDQSVDVMTQLLGIQPKDVALDDATTEACALLCRTCQEVGDFNSAREILRLVREFGPLSETVYYSFEPLNLLEGIISKLEIHAGSGQLHKQSISRAVDLYCHRFPDEPQVKLEQGFTVGKRLMQLAFAARTLSQIEALYWRCSLHHPSDLDFTQWYILNLHDAGDHKTAIKFFCLTYAKMSPSFHSVEEVGTAIVESVRRTQGYKSSAVLKALDGMCTPGDFNTGVLHTTWVIKLLEAHWTWKHNLDETAALFATLNRPLNKVIGHAEGVWRVMMELALKAGRPELADSYLKEAQEAGAVSWDYLTVMLFAKAKGEAGDWEGVFEDIKSIEVFKYGDKADRVSQRLVPILKLYAASHTAAETDTYVRRFVTDLQIPVCRNMVTSVATEYGSIRDTESLLAWLEYCATQGFRADAAFSNAILSTCRHTWKFSYQELWKLYRKLQELGEYLTDEHTERIMADAALSQQTARYEWRGHMKNLERFTSSRAPTRKAAAKASRNSSAQDITLMMKEQLVLRRPAKVVNIYRRAIQQGVDLPVSAFHLALKSALLLRDETGMETARELIHQAEKRGIDTSSLTARLILSQLDQIDRLLQFDAQYRAVSKVLHKAEKGGMKLNDTVYNQAAYRCLRANAYREAVNLAVQAAEVHQDGKGPGLCFNAFNFSILLNAFLRTRDLEMMNSIIATAKTMPYWTDTLCLRSIKTALAAAAGKNYPYPEAAAVLEEAKADCIEERRRLKEEGQELQKGALEIIKAAVKSQEEGLPVEYVLEEQRRKARENAESEQEHERLFEEIMLKAKREPVTSSRRNNALWADEVEAPAGDEDLGFLDGHLLSDASEDDDAGPLPMGRGGGMDPLEAALLSEGRA